MKYTLIIAFCLLVAGGCEDGLKGKDNDPDPKPTTGGPDVTNIGFYFKESARNYLDSIYKSPNSGQYPKVYYVDGLHFFTKTNTVFWYMDAGNCANWSNKKQIEWKNEWGDSRDFSYVIKTEDESRVLFQGIAKITKNQCNLIRINRP